MGQKKKKKEDEEKEELFWLSYVIDGAMSHLSKYQQLPLKCIKTIAKLTQNNIF